MATMLLKRCSHVYIRISGSINLNYLESNIKYVKCTAYYHEHCQRPRGDFVGLHRQQQLLSRQPCRLTLINKNSRIISCFHSLGSRNYTSDNQKQDAEKQRTTDATGRTRLDQTRIKFKETTEKFKETTDRLKETTDKFKERLEETIMKENIFTVPNLLCVTRIVLSPYLGYLILQHSFEFALGLFVFAGVTDLLDGFIARNFKDQQSMFGSFLDPMADKFLVFCLFISLTYINLIPIPLTSLIIARDVCLFGAGFYIRYLSLPPPKTLWRYFDATHATAQLSPTTISKVNTAVQLSLVACTLAAPVFHLASDTFFHTLWYLTAATTTLSGISYIFSKNSYHLLRKIKENRKN